MQHANDAEVPESLSDFLTQERERLFPVVSAVEGKAAKRNAKDLETFKRKLWRVSHGDEAMPGDEEHDLVVVAQQHVDIDPFTSERLRDPVKNKQCGHVYERESVLQFLQSSRRRGTECPIAGMYGCMDGLGGEERGVC